MKWSESFSRFPKNLENQVFENLENQVFQGPENLEKHVFQGPPNQKNYKPENLREA
jgi:hypothetical protein